MTTEQKELFIQEAERNCSKETVALLFGPLNESVAKPEMVFVENIHPQPADAFLVAPSNYVRADKKLVGVVHSHLLGTEAPSPYADKVMIEETAVPWYIYSLHTKKWSESAPVGFKMPLIGRPFIWGVLDCFALVRDYYKLKLNIAFKNYHREWGFWEKYNMIPELLEDGGMQKVAVTKPGDILLMNIAGKYPNHLAIIHDNPDFILHHTLYRLSGYDVFGGMWMKCTVGAYRHKSLL